MRGGYGICLVSILMLLLVPLVSAVPVLAPCVSLSIPLPHLAQYTVRVAPPYDTYLYVTNHILQGQLPCTVTGVQHVPLLLNGKIKQTIRITIAADYSFSVLQKDALSGCAEDILIKKFVLRNKGNVPNIFTLTGAVPSKIVLGPGKETLFTVTHKPDDPSTQTISLETTYGKKRQRYALFWDVTPCVALKLSVPEEVEVCGGKEGQLTYSVENNGTETEELTVANETFSLAPGEKKTKTQPLATDAATYVLSLQVRNKTIKAPVKVRKIPSCHKLTAPLSVEINAEEGTFSLPITHSGVEEATYAFETEHQNIQLQTKSLHLHPGEKSDLVFSYKNISRSEVLLIAQTANETQKIRVYINTGKSFIDWSWIDWNLLSLGEISTPYAGLGIIVLVVLIGGILFWRRKEKKEDMSDSEIDLAKAKPSWFAKYEHIDFDHLFDETEEAPVHIASKKTYGRTFLTIFLSLGILYALGLLTKKDPYLALGLGSIGIILGIFWLFIKKLRSISWKKIIAGIIFLIALGVFFMIITKKEKLLGYMPVLKTKISHIVSTYFSLSTLYTSPIFPIIGACIAGLFFLALLKKGWNVWKQWRERRRKKQEIAALATKIAQVERKTRSLKNALLRRSFTSRLLDFFYPETEELRNDQAYPSPAQITPSPRQTANDKQQTSDFLLQTTDHGLSTTGHQPLSTDHMPRRLWRYVTDFFFEDLPEDFSEDEKPESNSRTELIMRPRKSIKIKKKRNRRKNRVTSSR